MTSIFMKPSTSNTVIFISFNGFISASYLILIFGSSNSLPSSKLCLVFCISSIPLCALFIQTIHIRNVFAAYDLINNKTAEEKSKSTLWKNGNERNRYPLPLMW